MKIKYLGPSPEVKVEPYGSHRKNEVEEYPDDFGEELLATSKKQKFEEVDGSVISKTKAPKDMTVPDLKNLLDKLEVEYDAKAKKDDLVELVMKKTGEPPKSS